MTQIYPITDILDRRPNEPEVYALDTNILIQLADEEHRFNDTTDRFFERVMGMRVRPRFVYFVASRLELGDYFRKKFFTEYLRQLYRTAGEAGEVICKDIDMYCRHHPKLNGGDEQEVLSDREIKILREKCFYGFGDLAMGMKRWEHLCGMMIGKKLGKLTERLEAFGIEYANLYDKSLYPRENFHNTPKWEDQEKLMAQFGLGSADAAILNMAMVNPRVAGVISNDSDMAAIFRAGLVGEEKRLYTFDRRLVVERVG